MRSPQLSDRYFVLVAVVVFTLPMVFAPSSMWRIPTGDYSSKSAGNLLIHLAAAIDPSRPENNFFPNLAKEKIAWILAENQADRLTVNLVSNMPLGSGNFLAAASFEGGRPQIHINGRKLWRIAQTSSRRGELGKDELKLIFLNAMVHEAVHLEVGEKALSQAEQSCVGIYDEEFRVYTKVHRELIDPLHSIGKSFGGFVERDENELRFSVSKKVWKRCEKLGMPIMPYP